MTDKELKQAAEMYTEEYYFETPVQFFMAGADIGSRETKEELERIKLRLMAAKEIIKDFVDRDDSCWSIQKRAEEFLKECQ